jgi:hypothetical protein
LLERLAAVDGAFDELVDHWFRRAGVLMTADFISDEIPAVDDVLPTRSRASPPRHDCEEPRLHVLVKEDRVVPAPVANRRVRPQGSAAGVYASAVVPSAIAATSARMSVSAHV